MTADVPAAKRWLLSADELAVARVAVARANASLGGTRVASLTAGPKTDRHSGVRPDRAETWLSGDPEAVQAAAFEVTHALHWHEPGRWDIDTVLAWTSAVVAEYGWVPDTGRRQSTPPTWLLVDHLLIGAAGRDPRLDPEVAAVLPDRVLPRLEAAVQTAGRILTDLWAHYGRVIRPVTTVWPARIPARQRLTRALGNRDVPRAWLPQVVTAWAVWRDLPTAEAGPAVPGTGERQVADWERVAPPDPGPPDWPPATGGPTRGPVGI